jgi:hypothetical protein
VNRGQVSVKRGNQKDHVVKHTPSLLLEMGESGNSAKQEVSGAIGAIWVSINRLLISVEWTVVCEPLHVMPLCYRKVKSLERKEAKLILD